MPQHQSPEKNEAISTVHYATAHLDDFPSADRAGQATIGEIGADIETADAINIAVHTDGSLGQGGKYLAGALAVINSRGINE